MTAYISTSIPYVNSVPHVGFALELVQADILSRHARSRGNAVHFQSGTDDNSLKNVRAAEAAGLPVAEHVAANSARFRDLAEVLGVRFDDFVSTGSDERHRAAVHALWRRCRKAGDLYRKAYEGLYCVGCEQYYGEDELEDGCCPEHGVPPERIREDNWFFRLSAYGDRVKALVETGELEVTPESRRNEVLSFLRGPIEDICVSRSAQRARGWGIPVPDDDGEVVYVWFDALANYLTGAGYPDDTDRFTDTWSHAGVRTHLVGKGIARFHAVYWPAILLSAGLPLPTRVLVHGYLTVEGRKIGKSNGNGIDPFALADTHGQEALRWYLARHVRSTEDGDFSEAALAGSYRSDLSNQIGNLVSRTLAVVRKAGGTVPPHPGNPTPFLANVERLAPDVDGHIEDFSIHEAANAIVALAAEGNRYIVREAPWNLVGSDSGSDRERLHRVLSELLSAFRAISQCLEPFLPTAAARLDDLLEGRGAGTLFPAIIQDKGAGSP